MQEYTIQIPGLTATTHEIPNNFSEDYIERAYNQALQIPSDINQLLPTLHEYAKKCTHVTEMGARGGRSTITFVHANPAKFVSYDYQYATPEKHLEEEVNILKEFLDMCKGLGRDIEYIGKDVLSVEIEQTDMLFIDTWHVYQQLKKELELHASKVNKYIAFHDTCTFGEVGEGYPDVDENHPRRHEYDGTNGGIRKAIEEFLESNKNWVKVYETEVNNGLTIIEKIS